MTLDQAESRVALLVRLGFLRRMGENEDGAPLYGPGLMWMRAKWRTN